jgi:hypothetical protein
MNQRDYFLHTNKCNSLYRTLQSMKNSKSPITEFNVEWNRNYYIYIIPFMLRIIYYMINNRLENNIIFFVNFAMC